MEKNLKFKVFEIINERKQKAEALAEANLKLALKNADFNKNFKKQKELNFQIAKNDFLNLDTSKQQKEMQLLKNEEESLLKKIKLNKNDLTPNYLCKHCCDTGINKNDFCLCFYKLLNQEIVKNLGVNVDKTHCFSNAKYDIFDDSKKIKSLFENLKEWCDKYPKSNFKNIILVGTAGVGKTFLTECICNELVNKNLILNFFTAFSLNNQFLKFHTTFDQNKMSIIDGILNCDVLIVDDLGTEPIYNNVTEQYLYLVLNERLSKNKSTIITSNLMPNQILDRYGERIFSRMFNKSNSLLLKIENSDLRLKRKVK